MSEIVEQNTIFDSFLECATQMKNNRTDFFKEYKCSYGFLRGKVSSNDELFIYVVQVEKSRQNSGLLRDFLTNVISLNFSKICFLAVESYILDDYLGRYIDAKTGKKFVCYGVDWVLDLT